MPAQRHEAFAPVPPTDYDLPVAPTSWWRRRWPVAAAAALLVAGGVAAGALLLTHGHHARHRTIVSGPSPRPATSTAATSATPATVAPAELAARNLDAVLLHYSTQRGTLQAAINDVSKCHNVTAEANVIAGVVASRTAEIARLSSIGWAAMPSGPAMQADLTAALQDSRLADQDYQQWATGLEASCQPPAGGGPSYTAAGTLGTQAVAAKKHFLSLWRPLAISYSLASRKLLGTQL
jgi:hypothetical protein